jgi:hypothetical protein
MTTVQPPRHRAPAGTAGSVREPHPSGPVPVTEPPTVPIPRAALAAARAVPRPPVMPAPVAPAAAPAPVAPRNGLGITGLVLGLCGLVVGLIPLFGIGAILLGVVGLVLGLVGVTRARRGAATNSKTAVTGVVACLLAVALGITGMVIVANAVTQLGEDLSSVGATTPAAGAPSAGAAPATTAVGFGQTFTYSDGLAVTVAPPTAFRASSTAAGDTNPHAFSTTVRVTNNTGTAFDPTLLTVSMTTDGAPASSIVDSARGINGFAPQNQLQPGRSMTYKVAFSTTANTGEAQVDVVPSFQHEHAVFTGTL